jgi:hypothetical protein
VQLPLPPGLEPLVLADAPVLTIVRPVLGLTLYLAEPLVWAREGAAVLFEAFLASVPPGSLAWYTTSQLADWYPLDSARLDELRRALSPSLTRPRHLLETRVVDDTGASSVAFTYREVDERRAKRAATLELKLPVDSDPERLADLAVLSASRFPLLCGVGGLAASYNPHEKATAFWEIHGWCKRYLGLDVQDAEAMALKVLRGLPGTNWLTLVGRPLADRLRLDLASLASEPSRHDVHAELLDHALLLKAGPSPELGDLNRAEFPLAYAEVARLLAPHFVKDPPSFWGGFYEKEDTLAWLRRLVDPEGWQ